MKKGKSSKFGLIVGISAVTAVALAGTGIAGWVITTGASKDVKANITVYTAERKGLTISEIEWYKDDATKSENKVEAPSFIFGKSSSTHDKAWLTATDVLEEQLSLVMKFTVTKDVTEGSASDAAPVVSYTFGLSSKDQGSKYKDAKDKGYITDTDNPLDTENYEYTKEALTGTTTDNKVYTYTTVPLKFGWGTAFGGQNPYDYYNAKTGTDELGKTAENALKSLYNDLNGLSFTVTINANYAA